MVRTPFLESLNALHLLGSHFGIPGNATFDYVIVGGGTAGLALAQRLASESTYSVAIIEAGGFYELENGNMSSIAPLAVDGVGNDPLTFNPAIDWGQRSEPEPYLEDKPLFYPSGKTLGGSSARNYQAYHRGPQSFYEKWAETAGDPSYTFERVLPFYKRSVDFTPPDNRIRPLNATATFDPAAFSTDGGPLKVCTPDRWVAPMDSYMEASMADVGIPTLRDANVGELLGYNYVPVTQDAFSQTRSSSETSFLRQALLNTTNLSIYTHNLAKKIIFSGSNKTAAGVEVEAYGTPFRLKAAREVIVSAGVFRSPQLLMVSGVGPAEALKRLCIPVVADRPGVGQNLQDHVLFGPSWEVSVTTHSILGADPSYAVAAAEAFIANRTGILTNNGGILAWEKLPGHLRQHLSLGTQAAFSTQFAADWPEIEHLYIDAYLGNQKDALRGAPDKKIYASLAVALVAPFSRGNITVRSSDTRDHPVLHLNYLQDERDREFVVQMMRRAREVFASEKMKPVLVGNEAYPGSNHTTDAEILDFIKSSASTVHHASCTCKMGKRDDMTAVIDSRARVIGVHGLRVVDASSFPFLLPGHPQATIYMLAEKIAADILSKR